MIHSDVAIQLNFSRLLQHIIVMTIMMDKNT
jgi:hypothetical protein